MKNKIALICPYFGTFPNYFNLFIKSCAYNSNYTWIIITDNCFTIKEQIPNNVKFINMTFDNIKDFIQAKFDFNICLDYPYKLCDFKPCYGYIFEDLLADYDFWGHCDLDCIYGDISKFINDDILEKYDKISFLGHFTLYRNKKNINEYFKTEINKYKFDYKKILSSPKGYAFDESFNSLSLNTIFIENNIPFYQKQIFADVCCLFKDFRLYNYDKCLNFHLERKSNQIFKWDNGTLVSIKKINGKIKEKEYAYIHLQKRKMKLNIDINEKKYLIVPNAFVPYIDPQIALKKYKTLIPFSKKLIDLKFFTKKG